jgi:hypothetical protein
MFSVTFIGNVYCSSKYVTHLGLRVNSNSLVVSFQLSYNMSTSVGKFPINKFNENSFRASDDVAD